MATFTMPLQPSVPHYQFSVQLENVSFVFEFRWNERAGGWYMSVSKPDGTALLANKRVVLDFPLLARTRDLNLPKGELFALDTSGEKAEPGLDDLGDRVILLYTESADLVDAGFGVKA